VGGQESDTEWEIPDGNVEGFLHDQLGFNLADSWEAGNVRCFRFEHQVVKPGRRLASWIVVLQVDGVFTATLYEYPGEMGEHLRKRLASVKRQTPSFIEELNKLPNTANDHLTLYTIWGGRITETQHLAFQSAESSLLQETKAMLAELRMGASESFGTERFTVRLRQGEHEEKSGIIEFDLIQDSWRQRFDLILPGHDVFLQEAGVYGGLNGASFNAQFKTSLSDMSAEEYAIHSQPIHAEEAHQIARQILSNRPAMITVLPLRSNNPALRAHLTRFALHFAMAILD